MPKHRPLTPEAVRKLLHGFPGVEEAPCYGTPGFRVRKKFLARFHQDGESLVLKMDFETRAFVMQRQPRTYYITDHYRNYPTVLIRIAVVAGDELREHIEEAWRQLAPKRVVAQFTERDG